jgi:hypothetical protein
MVMLQRCQRFQLQFTMPQPTIIITTLCGHLTLAALGKATYGKQTICSKALGSCSCHQDHHQDMS